MSFDPSGAAIEDPYTATGSGMMFALGILQENYKENMTEKDAIGLATRAIYTAIRRDSASGDGIVIAVIDKMAPVKRIRVKGNTQEWFDDEIHCAINIRDKHFSAFKTGQTVL